MTAMMQPREWMAAITSPTRGVMDMSAGAWSHSPADIERVLVHEVLPDGLAQIDIYGERRIQLDTLRDQLAEAKADANSARSASALQGKVIRKLEAAKETLEAEVAELNQQFIALHAELDSAREAADNYPSAAIAMTATGSTDTAAAIDAAMTDLARELGCAYSDLIPHNTGLFIPGQAKACANPVDAIRRLFAHVYAGGHVLRPPIQTDKPAGRAAKADPSPTEVDTRQVALFEE